MDFLEILQRTQLKDEIKNCILSYKLDENKKKNIFIYGECGSGKTTFIKNIIKELEYDMIYCDSTDSRNKNYIESISSGNVSNKNVINMFNKVKKQIIIVIDDVDTVNDKNFSTMLVKLVRPKKTKKQKIEGFSLNQIICIGNYIEDKKIKELSSACITFKLDTPTILQITKLVQFLMPEADLQNVIEHVGCNLKKLNLVYNLYKKDKNILNTSFFSNIRPNYINSEVKECTKNIINRNYNKNYILSETDRNIIGLLLHENIVDVISANDQKTYIEFMKNICFSDYIDKFIFQKQIWQLNELNFNTKVFKNMYLLEKISTDKISDIRFTKILTKYSTEYNNYVFIKELCVSLSLDVKDMYQYFLQLRDQYSLDEIVSIVEQHDITQLEINRIFKFIDKLKNGDPDD
jgi:hypothetical protein